MEPRMCYCIHSDGTETEGIFHQWICPNNCDEVVAIVEDADGRVDWWLMNQIRFADSILPYYKRLAKTTS